MAVKARATITLSFMVDVTAVYRYYKLQASTAAAPSVPTTVPPEGWTDAEPTYTENSTNTLYTVDLNVFSDDSFLYTPVSVSSSYEAAKTAYNKAVVAQNGVNDINAGKPLFSTSGTDGTGGYVETIVITYNSEWSHLNKPIVFHINQRGVGSYALTFAWENTSGVPALAYLTTNRAHTSAVAVKWTDYMASIYIQKSEEWDVIDVMRVENPYANGGVTVELYGDNTSYVGSELVTWTSYGYLYSWVDKECATNYMNFTAGTGLVIGDMNAGTLGNNVLIDSSSVDIRNGTTTVASFGASGIEFDAGAVFTADTMQINNSNAYFNLGENAVLWSHENGYYMHGTQSINLAANITRQLSGAVFCWCYYANGVTQGGPWLYFYVPKYHIISSPGAGVYMSDPYVGIRKYLYISNGIVSGIAENANSGTANGIAWNNVNYTLRAVIGV